MSAISSLGAGAQGLQSLQQSTAAKAGGALQHASQSFSNVLEQINQQQNAASEAVSNMADGKEVNLSGVVTSLVKAELSLKMLLEVRNKVVEAHQELMRMQV